MSVRYKYTYLYFQNYPAADYIRLQYFFNYLVFFKIVTVQLSTIDALKLVNIHNCKPRVK